MDEGDERSVSPRTRRLVNEPHAAGLELCQRSGNVLDAQRDVVDAWSPFRDVLRDWRVVRRRFQQFDSYSGGPYPPVGLRGGPFAPLRSYSGGPYPPVGLRGGPFAPLRSYSGGPCPPVGLRGGPVEVNEMRAHALRRDLLGRLDLQPERIAIERQRLGDVRDRNADVIECHLHVIAIITVIATIAINRFKETNSAGFGNYGNSGNARSRI